MSGRKNLAEIEALGRQEDPTRNNHSVARLTLSKGYLFERKRPEISAIVYRFNRKNTGQISLRKERAYQIPHSYAQPRKHQLQNTMLPRK